MWSYDNEGRERTESKSQEHTKHWTMPKKGSPLQVAEGEEPCQHLDLGLLGSRTVRQ